MNNIKNEQDEKDTIPILDLQGWGFSSVEAFNEWPKYLKWGLSLDPLAFLHWLHNSMQYGGLGDRRSDRKVMLMFFKQTPACVKMPRNIVDYLLERKVIYPNEWEKAVEYWLSFVSEELANKIRKDIKRSETS